MELSKNLDFRVSWFSTLTSTNDVCMQQAVDGEAEGIVIAAHQQQKGRGQRGNVWNSEQSKNLTFSILLRPRFLRVEDQFQISKVVAISLCECVQQLVTTEKVQIKWPNDIYVGNNKVSGVLIENSFSSEMLDVSVVGIGLNVNQVQFPANVPNPTSIAKLAGREFNIEVVLEKYLGIFNKWYSFLQKNGHALIDEAYLKLLYRRGECFSYISKGVEFSAQIEGVSPIGELILQLPNGTSQTFAFKEVAFVI